MAMNKSWRLLGAIVLTAVVTLAAPVRSADAASPRDEFGLPTGYIEGPRFGQGTANTDYPRPRPGQTGGRMFLMAAGFRF